MTKKNSRLWIKQSILTITLMMSCVSYMKAQVGEKASGFVDFNGYYDTRNYSVMTYNILANLPHRFQYFSLTNYQGVSPNSELDNFYAEHNVRYELIEGKPMDATVQYIMRAGKNNDKIRFGFRWRLHGSNLLSRNMKKLGVSYSINPMFVDFGVGARSSYMSVIEHVYSVKLWKDKLYLAGFADQNFARKGTKIVTNWVTEHQLGYRLVNQLFAVLEYRINEYSKQAKTGLGLGLEYKINF